MQGQIQRIIRYTIHQTSKTNKPPAFKTRLFLTANPRYKCAMAVKYIAPKWSGKLCPTSEDIGLLAEQSYRALPHTIHAMCGNITLRVEEMADMDLIELLGGSSPYELLGLFHPLGETFLSNSNEAPDTHLIVLYRRAIIDYWAESEETLDAIITHVIVQEVGRQFEFDEDQLEKIEISTNQEIERETKAMMQ